MSVDVSVNRSPAKKDPELGVENQPNPEKANPPASTALARMAEPGLASTRPATALSGLEGAFLAFLQSKIPSSVVPVERRIFLSMAESAEYSGLPVAFLRRLITSGRLKALKTGAGWRIARTEIETLSGTLTVKQGELSEHELRDIEINRRRRQGTALPSDDFPGFS
jgi:excisionase family DNA binding protein